MIVIRNLFLKYIREYFALYDINMELAEGETVAFIGESESGKTSLLRVIAKLENYTKGELYIKDIPLKKINFACDVNLAYISEKPLLYENKSVYENLKLILKSQNEKKLFIEQKIDELLIDFNIEKIKDIKVKEISLLEKYIVCIARASLRDLDIVLVDGIFDNLSAEDFEYLQELFVKKILKNKPLFILSTKNEEIAKKMCKRKIYFQHGSVIKDKTRK